MLAQCRRLQERWGLALAIALTLSLFVRLAAPYVGAADRDGYVAICTGSELVYLPVDQNGVPLPDGEAPDKPDLSPLHLPCNWLGHYIALLPVLQALVLPAWRPLPPEQPKPDETYHPKGLKPFHSQAPPAGCHPKH